MRTLTELQTELEVAPEAGLTSEAALRSRKRFGANRLTPLPREPLWKKFLDKFDEPIIKILLAAALLSMVVDLFKPPVETMRYVLGGVGIVLAGLAIVAAYIMKQQQWIPSLLFVSALFLWPIGLATGHASYDGLAVMVAVVLATGVAFLSEYKSDREFEVLNAHKDSLHIKVQRDGAFHTVPLEEVVVGDAVVLEMGDEIPADGRLVKATDLYVDQSLMTGESEAVRKQVRPPDDDTDGPEQAGCLYRGTQVVDGVGQMMVAEVGDKTYLGKIARRLAADDDDDEAETETEQKRVKRKLTISKELTPLQEKLENLAGIISKVGYVAAGAIFLALLARGMWFSNPREVFWPGSVADALTVAGALLGYFMYMVIIIVVAVPEGLPMSVTVSLALAMRKMTRANSLVRQLVACETVGSTTVICSDKTGTLTQNKMQVVRVSWEGQAIDRGGPDWALPEKDRAWPRDGKPLDWIALNAGVNSTANLEEKEGKLLPVGNSTEGALLQWLHESGIEYLKLRLQFQPLYQVHFSSDRKRMTTVIRHGERLAALVKGAPEWVLEQCSHYQKADGTTAELTPELREATQTRLREAAAQAMRTLAFGYTFLPPETPDHQDGLHECRDSIERGLVYAGFVAIRDPLREDVKEAVADCRRAGIEVKMITGDNIETARAIATEIGLIDRPEALVITSAEFNALDDADLKAKLPHLRVLARARPLDKFRMVKALQELNEVVAVTGDGTNDAPALKKADVGLAMGRAGTEVAKEASKIVLLDDAFSTIVKAVHWGRSLYENIQRFIQFQLTINVSALVIAFLGPFFGVKPPFTILQLLWINVIMDTFAAIALCSEPPRPGLMRLPPKKRDENILTRAMLGNIFTTAVFFIIVMIVLLVGMERRGDVPGWFAGSSAASTEFPELTVRQVAIFFTVYVMFQVWNEINCRSLVPDTSGFAGLFRNPVFLTILGITVLGQVVIITFGGEVFKVEPLSIVDWLVITACTASVLVFAEVTRRVRMKLQKS
ncbi:MAG: cation-translocating P-type ATPase [Gemmataceae bacterium]|nr:cation-translocating P-type ATPase [Gemmataceae bacterium]